MSDVARETLEQVIFAESESGSTESDSAAREAEVSDASSDIDDSDWADDTDWINEDDESKTDDRLDRRSRLKENPVKEKPNLLAMPLILVGWAKDVVVSMTKPKPSKPMIEIPRRESPIESTQSASSSSIPEQPAVRQSDSAEKDIAPAPPVTTSTSVQTDSSFDADPKFESEPIDWEESNWDD